MTKKLYKSRTDRKVAGICGGIAEYLNIDSTVIRVIWFILILCAFVGVLAYIACIFLIPDRPDGYIDV